MKQQNREKLESLLMPEDAMLYDTVDDLAESILQEFDDEQMTEEESSDIKTFIEQWWTYNDIDSFQQDHDD